MSNLLSIDDYKLIKGISSNINDDKIEALLTSTSQLVRTYCSQEFDTYAGPYGTSEVFDIQWGTHVVQLHESPVISINSVFERTSQSEPYVELFSNGTNGSYDWYFDPVTDAIFRTMENGSYRNWPRGVGSVKVIYRAGYEEIPEDLKLAIADLVTYYDKSEYRQMQAIGSATREGAPASAIRNDPGFPDHIRRVLDLYRNV